MKHTTSLYLDLLRIIAAAGVFFGHATFPWFSTGVLPAFDFAHGLVIVFFFLSGYVMANATLREDCDLQHYVAARLSRLYSVVAPAVVLTAVLFVAGRILNPAFYSQFERGSEGLRLVLSVFFLQENWFLSASPPTNGPLWSLGYEFWYYAIFGCWVFAPTRFVRAVLVALASLVAGPKILLLLPVWLMGAGCWCLRDLFPIARWPARAGFVLSTVVAGLLLSADWRYPCSKLAAAPWFYSSWFFSDWLMGAAIFLNVFFFERAFSAGLPRFLENGVRRGAAMTFSLYAFHYPMLIFAGAAVPYNKTSAGEVGLVLATVLGVVFGLQRVTEARRRSLQRVIGIFWRGKRPAARVPESASV